MRKLSLIYGLVLAAVLLYALIARAEAATYELRPERSRITFKGDSPLHGFTGTTSMIRSGQLAVDPETGTLMAPVEITVPVLSLATGNEARDHAVQYTLQDKDHPLLALRATTIHRTEGGADAGTYRLEGDITVAGVLRPITADCRVVREDGGMRVSGRLPLSLSMFGLKPPPLARWMRLRDPVEVEFETGWTETQVRA